MCKKGRGSAWVTNRIAIIGAEEGTLSELFYVSRATSMRFAFYPVFVRVASTLATSVAVSLVSAIDLNFTKNGSSGSSAEPASRHHLDCETSMGVIQTRCLMGMKISKGHVYELCKQRTKSGEVREHPIPCIRLGTSVRFSKAAVEEWVQRLSAR